jgi:uncharacterized membrane protein YdbT with pleckstrin-like domain
VPLVVIAALGIIILPQSSADIWVIVLWLFVESALFFVLLWAIEDWRNDYFQITPSRMIMVDRRPLLLSESRRETTLDKIQNISFDIPSVTARLLKYGDVMLETAGATGKFELKWVRHPQKIQAEISGRKPYDGLRKKSQAPVDGGESAADSPTGTMTTMER